jgi:hypothetical protein
MERLKSNAGWELKIASPGFSGLAMTVKVSDFVLGFQIGF